MTERPEERLVRLTEAWAMGIHVQEDHEAGVDIARAMAEGIEALRALCDHIDYAADFETGSVPYRAARTALQALDSLEEEG